MGGPGGRDRTLAVKRRRNAHKSVFATTQLNSTQSWVGLIFLRNHKPQPQTTTEPNRPSLFLSSYTTKLDQIQYAFDCFHIKSSWSL